MRLIESKTLATAAASIEFTSIPQTFTDLVVVISPRSNAGGFRDFLISFNGSTSGFTSRQLDGNGSGASSGTVARYVGTVNGTPQTADTFGNISVYIPNYSGATNKSFSSDAVTETNATASIQTISAGLWSNTAAITSVAFAPSTDSLVTGTTASLYGVSNKTPNVSPKATGGITQRVGDYFVHTFNTSGIFTPLENLTNVEYLVIAGGGGSTRQGGGAGAGGYRSSVVGESSGGGGAAESRLSLTALTQYAVTVGAGGPGRPLAINDAGISGTNSIFSSITSTGGGGGGGGASNPLTGGSGGGAGAHDAARSGVAGTTNQGFGGGNNVGVSPFPAGGGGGAGGAGANATSSVSGNGGIGVSSSINGTATFRAGGGGAGGYVANPGTGGSGGGGNGSIGNTAGNNATINSGGGAGGAGNSGDGANGGSGIVIVRYLA
jgi:hypothetical protein